MSDAPAGGAHGPTRGGELKYALAGAAGARMLDLLLGTTRLEPVNTSAYETHQRQGRAVVFALWHGGLLPPTYRHRHTGIVTLASRSGDGEYITRMLGHWGYHVVRGSSSRGGDTALRELIRLVRQGRSVAITADGPRGPRQRLKHGVLQLAQLTGAPLVPVGSAASRAWRLGSWDRFMVPKPFARLRIVYGDAVFVERKTDAHGLGSIAADVEASIAKLTSEAEAAFA
jgi:lysophospholipid acyltransferase (LPLAT)-like uncharacterized protein